MTPDFSRHTAKLDARTDTVVMAYRALSGRRSIPRDRAYVTLGGRLFDDAGLLQIDADPFHMERAGLIEIAQCHSVEHDPVVHAGNLRVTEKLPRRPTLHLGDIADVMDGLLADETFHPCVVNVDLMVGPRAALRPLRHVLSILNHYPGHMMVVWNVAVRIRNQDFTHDLELIRHDATIGQACLVGDWTVPGELSYQSQRTWMLSTIFWRAR